LIEVACINDETMHERIEQIRKLLGDGEVRVEPHVDVRAVRANF
jgi:hypothetical protein